MSRPITTRRRVRTLLAAVTATSLVVLSGCTSSDEGGDDSYLVGFPALTSGPAAFAGVPITQGAELAVKEINDSEFLGEGATLELKIDDIKGDPAQAISLYRQYVADGASGVLCCGLSSEAGALAPMIEQSKTPAIVTSAILAGLAKPPYIYRPVVLPAEPGGMYDQFVDAVVPAEGIETAVLVVTSDNDGMVGDAEVWKAALERNGVDVVKTINTASADTNFTQAATEVASLDPDVVVQSMLGTPSALMARALRERDFDKRILTSYGIDSKELFDASGGGLAGTLFAVPFHAGFTDNEAATTFVEAYQEEYDAEPDMYGAQGYTAMWLMATAIKEAGSKDPEKVAEALEAISEQDSVYGPLTYSDGQATLNAPGSYLEWTADGTLAEWAG
ncbi:ABC transporter substrate-binding protein [Nocardioides lianchengensis]|uniref:Branched-chain amino acid transport system substrate-binding protein n=1 Tax=Nocardioides lianchengensis TaxID=1045774 RepID=A0A1G7BI70_9ACTN|nr:ABC transporter substrate-binding protein [Nocardioides lianchengensis]NYG08986.1 branched-chain amino acid transport system substrate-binding protein [Nocardioides lianchengensis]SDE26801.1 branched-chain amino acid transport system substrate-binding protein [Nocardioides lianchengensis]